MFDRHEVAMISAKGLGSVHLQVVGPRRSVRPGKNLANWTFIWIPEDGWVGWCGAGCARLDAVNEVRGSKGREM